MMSLYDRYGMEISLVDGCVVDVLSDGSITMHGAVQGEWTMMYVGDMRCIMGVWGGLKTKDSRQRDSDRYMGMSWYQRFPVYGCAGYLVK